MKQATYNNGQLVAMSGPRNPYPGKLGMIEEGALADILLINGDPLTDLSLLTKPDENLTLIMKNGTIEPTRASIYSARIGPSVRLILVFLEAQCEARPNAHRRN
jgi:imidazolonepropionase-like amidohydrolase